jgi:HK97 family phage portal protein
VIVRSRGRDVEIRSSSSWPEAWPYSPEPPAELVGGSLFGGHMLMTLERALGLPALLGVLLRLGQGAGMVPLKVYRGQAPSREAALDSYQYELLHDRPSSECPPFAFYADLAASIAGVGYGPVRKYKANGRRGDVKELLVLDASKVTPKRQGGRIVFEDRTEGQTVTRDQTEIVCPRGLAFGGGVVGLSPISAARLGILTGIKRQAFEYRYFRNNAEARVVLAFPQQMDRSTAEEWVDLWEGDHQGEENWHRTGAIGGGATVTHLPVSLEDAQFVEANRMTSEQIGGIYGIPKSFLNVGDNAPTSEDWRFMVTFGLGWILTTIAQSFSHDRDLFPIEQRPENRMHAEHVVDALLKPDIKTRYEAYRLARQAGWLTANEIRALENYPPHDNGDELQATPVGGAPNERGDAVGGLSWLLQNATPEQHAFLLETAVVRALDGGVRLEELTHANGNGSL